MIEEEVYEGVGDSPQCIGVQPEILENIAHDTVVWHPERNDVPLLVKAEDLYWYNTDVMDKLTGDAPAYIYAHAEMVDDAGAERIAEAIRKDGAAVYINTDGSVGDDSRVLEQKLGEYGVDVREVENVFQNQYIGEIVFPGVEGYLPVPSVIDAYDSYVDLHAEGQGTYAELVRDIQGDELEHLWSVYNSRFEGVAENSISEAAFDEAGFKEIMHDPSVVKAVSRVDGKIASVTMFMTDMEHASWLNKKYYEKHYGDALETGNLLLFLGIVSDPEMPGGHHSLAAMNLLVEVGKRRGSNALITFECNEVSYAYLPEIVKGAIESTGIASVEGLEKPVSQSRFLIAQSAK